MLYFEICVTPNATRRGRLPSDLETCFHGFCNPEVSLIGYTTCMSGRTYIGDKSVQASPQRKLLAYAEF